MSSEENVQPQVKIQLKGGFDDNLKIVVILTFFILKELGVYFFGQQPKSPRCVLKIVGKWNSLRTSFPISSQFG